MSAPRMTFTDEGSALGVFAVGKNSLLVALACILLTSLVCRADEGTELTLPTSPLELLSAPITADGTVSHLGAFGSLAGTVVSLLEFVRSHVDPEPRDVILARYPAYNRRQHFGGWINQDSDKNCLDTRNEVLVRDAVPGSQIGYKEGTCMVVSGRWHDPYTGTEFKTARSVQIDHVVPLKNAYASGAYGWSYARRCHYANFLSNRFHLLAVSGHENMTKGQNGPERYLPPDETYTCTYLHEWMLIKAIWNLNVTSDEKAAIERLLVERNCPIGTADVSQAELKDQSDKSEHPVQKCLDHVEGLVAPAAPEDPASLAPAA